MKKLNLKPLSNRTVNHASGRIHRNLRGKSNEPDQSTPSHLYTCACCGYQTIHEKGIYDICPVCFWEDDQTQNANPFENGFPNRLNLIEAQINFKQYGACRLDAIQYVRAPKLTDIQDSIWTPVLKLNEDLWKYTFDSNGFYLKELIREISKDHILHDKKFRVIAVKSDTDAILLLMEEGMTFALVHMTFKGDIDTNDEIPITELFDDITDLNMRVS